MKFFLSALLFTLALPGTARAEFLDFPTCGTYKLRGTLRAGDHDTVWLELYPETSRRYFIRLVGMEAKEEELMDVAREFKVRLVFLGGSRVTRALWLATGPALLDDKDINKDPERISEGECLKARVR